MLTAVSIGMIDLLCFDLELHPCELHKDPGHHSINVMDTCILSIIAYRTSVFSLSTSTSIKQTLGTLTKRPNPR
jgi:hypothetical protein